MSQSVASGPAIGRLPSAAPSARTALSTAYSVATTAHTTSSRVTASSSSSSVKVPLQDVPRPKQGLRSTNQQRSDQLDHYEFLEQCLWTRTGKTETGKRVYTFRVDTWSPRDAIHGGALSQANLDFMEGRLDKEILKDILQSLPAQARAHDTDSLLWCVCCCIPVVGWAYNMAKKDSQAEKHDEKIAKLRAKYAPQGIDIILRTERQGQSGVVTWYDIKLITDY